MAQVSLGYVKNVTPGTLLRLTNNQSSTSTVYTVHRYRVSALPDNQDVVYLGTASMNAGSGTGVLAIIYPAIASDGVAAGSPLCYFDIVAENSPESYDLSKLYIDATVTGDGVLVTADIS